MTGGAPPALSGIVVHWRDEEGLSELVAAWPRDPRLELVVVDNGTDPDTAHAGAAAGALPEGLPPGIAGRVLRPGENLGFAGGADLGVAASRGEVVLLLNPDAVPREGALDALLDGFSRHPEAAGLAPRLEGPDGRSQHRWQLGRVPTPGRLVLEAWFLPAGGGDGEEPEAGSVVEQPAAAALALRRHAWERLGGMDPRFHPAWFEDVDLARRMRDAGERCLYWPEARFRHRRGATVPRLGYGRFLWIYYRNLDRYLAKHHGRSWAAAARLAVVKGMVLRLLLLPLRRPRRAAGRGEAAAGLLAAALGAASGWRAPKAWARGEEW